MNVSKLVLAAVLTVVPAGMAHAHGGEEATGFGDAKWGMSPEEVKRIFPELELIAAEPPTSDTEVVIKMSLYRLTDQKVGDNLTCNIDVKFLVGKLSYLDYYCRDKKDVPSYLKATFGPPSTEGESGWLWQGKFTNVTYAPSIGTFSVAQKRANDALQGAVFLYQMMQQEKPGQGKQQQQQSAQPPAQAN